jgi:ATP phosphoribosyltransferase regulatory subunit HisZ
MNMEKLNHWLTLVANFGVIAGVVFLAYELRQNNELLEQGSRYSMLQNQKDWTQFIASNEEISNLLYARWGRGWLT